jgi:hypothetical protein
MSAEHKQLLWRYRFALTKEKAALTKFLNCVDWTDQEEVAQAVELTGEWERQVSIDINDALQLLSANFTHPKAPAPTARSPRCGMCRAHLTLLVRARSLLPPRQNSGARGGRSARGARG